MANKKPAPATEDQPKREHNLTKVSVKSTKCKYFDVEGNTAKTVTLTGKLTLKQCQDYAKGINPKNVVITKESFSESFMVDTVALIQLREPEPVA